MPSGASELAFKNDLFRAFGPSQSLPGRCVMTQGVGALPGREAIVEKVRSFNAFEDDCHRRDFGSFEHEGQALFWKIDHYSDSSCQYGAEPDVESYRVLTVMLAEEY